MGCFFVSKIRNITEHTNLISEYEGIFRCPVCMNQMRMVHRKSLLCTKGHCFDLSKHGYINLLTRASNTKYSKQMFKSRRAICKGGFFEPLIEIISKKIMTETSKKRINILDAGCGEGSHLSSIQEKISQDTALNPLGVGIDISKEGISLASREYPNAIWCVTDLAHCPFAGEQFDFILNILSPSNYSEFTRMITDDGMVIKVIPNRDYLKELREAFYNETNRQEYSNDKTLALFKSHFQLVDVEQVRYRFALDHTPIESLLQMTPLSWGSTEEGLQKILQMDVPEITIDLTILFGKKNRTTGLTNI
ncbi:methyltransferase domain-containing protein [Brevibacillus laterosporus]|uniref:Methyltransferase domain-containing protein n=2 Tax=Brevibacillus laterosporus TaxID=1465 RepID=A0AAP3DGS5_BRELA|nr:methyltransferase domain-containing protein [Brevibacillus laterosporus]MCZ0807831.1 methyltransferase domain-containing protein [Brevibacillus laterosporus]MCZ0826107.1 methyltransferase domain-containing protein [Brevibacillus laterosporus]MCZ0849726.1 methyltransferase domain-containing protein [Brevibacillus laterosporus]MED1662856.1 methyltransferase domain-containing protein [Brevibacillus laterosporus]